MAILDRTDYDEKTGLSLVHYRTDTVYTGETESYGRLRGMIVDKNDVVLYTFFPKPDEWVAGDLTPEQKETDVSEYQVFVGIEAALLRLFWYDGRWFLTTNRKLDAFQSRWSSKYSFGEMFQYTLQRIFPDPAGGDVLAAFYEQLDPALQYVFMIRFNNENRIVCNVNTIDLAERVVFLGYFDPSSPGVFQHAHNRYLDHPMLSRLGRQKQSLSPVDDKDDNAGATTALASWEEYVLRHIDPTKNPGIILIHNTLSRHIKIQHPEYVNLARLRGNQPNLAVRYLELRNQRPDLDRFMRLYDRNARMFQQMEDILNEIARKINFWYTERYVHNRFISVPFPEYNIMKKCHQWYLDDPINRRVYIRVVTDFLNREPPLILYRIINRFRQETYRAPGAPHFYRPIVSKFGKAPLGGYRSGGFAPLPPPNSHSGG